MRHRLTTPLYKGLRPIGAAFISAALMLSSVPTAAFAVEDTPVDKAETVYVRSNPDGSVREVSVKEVLTNVNGDGELYDYTTLKNIESEVEHTTNGDSQTDIVWTTDGKEVEYRGTTDKKPPVLMHVTYTLDGKAISAKDLAGKSGHLSMRFAYQNGLWEGRIVDGEVTRIYTPFVAVTSVTLSRDVFSNVKIENGKLSDGSGSMMAIGYTMPGMQDSLNTKGEIDFPSYFTIDADVKNFELGPVTTIVTAELLAGMEATGAETEDMSESLHTMGDVMAQLTSGSDELAQALTQIADGQDELVNGIGTFRDVTGELHNATNELSDGVNALSEGISTAQQSAHDLAENAEDLPTYLGELAGATSDASTLAGTVSTGLNDIANGLNGLQADAALINDAKSDENLSQPLSEIAENVDKADKNAETALNALKAIDLNQLDANQAQAVVDAIDALSDLRELDAKKTTETLTDASETLSALEAVDTEGLANGIASAAEGTLSAKLGVDTIGSALNDVSGSLSGAQQLAAALSSGVDSLAGGLDGANDGANTLATGARELSDTMPEYVSGVDEIKDGASKLAEASREAADGSGKLSEGINEMNADGVKKLVDSFDTNLKGVSERVKLLSEAANKYDTFAGKAEGTKGKVTFIYKTDAIGQ